MKMYVPTINRSTVKTLAPLDALASSSAAVNLHQRSEPPTQRASHSLGSVGKRMLKGVGKLFQKSAAPRQAAARAPSAIATKARQTMAGEPAGQQAAGSSRPSGSQLHGADGSAPSILRPTTNAQRPNVQRQTLQSSLLAESLQTQPPSRIEHDTQTQNTIALSAAGKADFASFGPSGMPQLLDFVLGKPKRTYLAQHSQPGAQQHLVLESSGE